MLISCEAALRQGSDSHLKSVRITETVREILYLTTSPTGDETEERKVQHCCLVILSVLSASATLVQIVFMYIRIDNAIIILSIQLEYVYNSTSDLYFQFSYQSLTGSTYLSFCLFLFLIQFQECTEFIYIYFNKYSFIFKHLKVKAQRNQNYSEKSN